MLEFECISILNTLYSANESDIVFLRKCLIQYQIGVSMENKCNMKQVEISLLNFELFQRSSPKTDDFLIESYQLLIS